MSRLGAAALVALFALSVSAPAMAQSVGDDQYRDPFAGQGGGNEETSGGGGRDDAAAPSPTPTAAPAPAPDPPPTDPVTGEPIATVADPLPRTGSAAGWVAAAGLLLIAAGAGLRRTART